MAKSLNDYMCCIEREIASDRAVYDQIHELGDDAIRILSGAMSNSCLDPLSISEPHKSKLVRLSLDLAFEARKAAYAQYSHLLIKENDQS